MTDQQHSRTEHLWTLVQLSAWAVAVIWGLMNVPEPIEGIPFIQVIPALFIGGLVMITFDVVRYLVSAGRGEVFAL